MSNHYKNNQSNVDGIRNILNEITSIPYAEFVLRSKKIFQNDDGSPKYTGYDNKENINNWKGTNQKNEITLFCPKTPPDFPDHPHGEFKVLPSNHIHGNRGCDVCSNNRLTKYTWLQKIKNSPYHKDADGDFLYDYDKVPFDIKSDQRIKIICPKHSDFESTPKRHLQGRGCRDCYFEKRRDTKDEWIEKIKKSGFHQKDGELIYNYDNVVYKNGRTLVQITCPIHGDFLKTPQLHLLGVGCPDCSKQNRGEKNFEDYLKNNFKSYKTQKRFPLCVGNESRKTKRCTTLPFDFYLPEYKTAIEIDGEGHFNPGFRGGNTERYGFEERKQYDTIKNEFVKKGTDSDIDYLIRIAYLGGNTQKMIEDFEKLFKEIEKSPSKRSIFLSVGYPEKGWNDPEYLKKMENLKREVG